MLIQNEADVLLLMSPARNQTTDGTGFLLEISHSQQATGRTGRIILFLCFGPIHGAGAVGVWFAGRPLQTPEMTFRPRTPVAKVPEYPGQGPIANGLQTGFEASVNPRSQRRLNGWWWTGATP